MAKCNQLTSLPFKGFIEPIVAVHRRHRSGKVRTRSKTDHPWM